MLSVRICERNLNGMVRICERQAFNKEAESGERLLRTADDNFSLGLRHLKSV